MPTRNCGGNSERQAATQGEQDRGNNPAFGPVSAPLCKKEQEQHNLLKLPPAGYLCACF